MDYKSPKTDVCIADDKIKLLEQELARVTELYEKSELKFQKLAS